MLKQLLQFRTLLLALLVMAGAGNGWAEETTVTQTTFSSTSGYVNNDNKVSYTSYKGGGTSNPEANSDAIRLYQNSSGATGGYVVIGVSEGYVITSATIRSTMATTTGYLLTDSSPSSTPLKNAFNVSNKVLTANTDYTVSDISSRYITFACFGTSKTSRLYLSKISITYQAENSSAVQTTTTIDASGITNTDVYTGTSAGFFSATVKDDSNNTIDGASVTWSSSKTSVATIDSSTGVVTLVAPGTTKITASYKGKDNYAPSSDEYTLTVTSSDPAVETFMFANLGYEYAESVTTVSGRDCTLLFNGGTNTQNAPKYYTTGSGVRMYNGNTLTISSTTKTIGSIEFTFDGNNTALLLVSNQPGELSDVLDSKRTWTGNANSVQFTTTATNRIQAITITYVTTEMGETTLQLNTSDVNTPYGTDATVDATVSSGYDGTLTAESSNDLIATASVKGPTITITPVAVGKATINVTAPETSTFSGEAKETINVTVTAPKGKMTAAVNGYGKVTSTSDLKSGEYLIVYEDGNVAFNGGLETLDGVSNTVPVTINNNVIAITDAVDAAAFTIDVAAGTIKSASGKYIGVLSNSNGLKQSEEATYTNSFSIDEDGNAVISAVFSGSTMSLRYNKASNQERFRYYGAGQEPIALYKKTSLTATLNGSGYATYCSEYPLDFSNAKGYSAWQVTGVVGNAITFEKVTGSVKGGTGLLLMGEHDATVTLTSKDSDTELKTNKLKGTLAPTYVKSETIYGLSGNTFKKNNDGTFKANKAYILASDVDGANNVRTLSLVFVDPTTGIAETKTMTNEDAIYNLAGQRISKAQRGINIVGGKKVLVK